MAAQSLRTALSFTAMAVERHSKLDINNLANMRMSDFENLGKEQYNKGFVAALSTVIKLLGNQICEDYNADGVCEHDKCHSFFELSEGLSSAKNNIQ